MLVNGRLFLVRWRLVFVLAGRFVCRFPIHANAVLVGIGCFHLHNLQIPPAVMNHPNKTLTVLKSVLGNKVVSYHSVFARALRNVPAGVMLSQGFFWQENANYKDLREIDGRMYFTATAMEWYEATGVTDDQQLTARDVLRSCGFWLEKRAGLPAKLYFHIDLDILVSVIYGFLENGKQVSVDTRHKNREITRASDGKFRQPVTVNYGNTNIGRESKRVFESVERGAHAQNQFDKNQKKEKAPPIPPPPPVPTATTFAESIWATSTTGAFAQALHQYAPETADADADYYRKRCRDYSAQHPTRTKSDWIAFAAQIIADDRHKQKLITLQSASHASNTNNPTAGPSNQQSLLDRDNIAQRAAVLADRYRRKQGRYQQ